MNCRKVGLFFILGFTLGVMKIRAQVSFTLDRGTPGVSSTPQAMESPVLTPDETIRIPKPIILDGSDRLSDSEYHSIPKAPPKGPDGNPWKIETYEQTPRGAAMAQLEEPAFFNRIMDWNKSETKPRVYYWHLFNGTDYCHLRDLAGNQWFGWAEGSAFRWALYHSGHFWWRDNYAERSLYFDRGYWWWQGLRKNQFQVYLEDGDYHICGSYAF